MHTNVSLPHLSPIPFVFMCTAMEISTMAEAMQLHAQLLKSNHRHESQNLSKLFTFTALSPAGNLHYARRILNSLHTPNSYYHNTMIRAYSDSPNPSQAIELFLTMHTHHDSCFPRPDKFTYPFVIKVCSKLRDTHFGKQLHGLIFKSGLISDVYILNGLIHMYASCGEMSLARKVFDKMPDRDVYSWTSLIDGFVDNNLAIEAMDLFEQMLEDGVDPSDATFVAVLRACADTGALGVGLNVNKMVDCRDLASKSNISYALIDMYAKCGCIHSAIRVFDETVNKNVFCWTAMIFGLASHGMCADAINLFEQMKSVNVNPDERTMTAVLSACRNAGWVKEGLSIIKNMKEVYKIKPTIQHYGCIVDLLARLGLLEEAEFFIKSIPIEPDVVLWRTLVWACKFHGDNERAERLMIEHLKISGLDSRDCGSYVLLGNVYAATKKWHDKAKVRGLMNQKGLLKPPGYSRIEIDGIVHEFTAGGSYHVEAENIYAKLGEIDKSLKRQGYNPNLSEVLLEVDDEEKASQLLHHSEKLAVSFALIMTRPGTVIRIVKNLRSCEDCHSFMKHISKIYRREIIIRDRIRFHYFSEGKCSCGDYW